MCGERGQAFSALLYEISFEDGSPELECDYYICVRRLDLFATIVLV